MMRIIGLETLRRSDHENLIWLRLFAESGHCGLGETFFAPTAIESFLHEIIAPQLLGADATRIEQLHARFMRYPVGYAGSSVEIRAASAVDMALWDLFGRASGLPLWRLFGGLVRDSIRVYNTCAGPHYVAKRKEADAKVYFGIAEEKTDPLDDLKAFLKEPARLAHELLAEGVSGMKIWPFDFAAFARGGVGITAEEIEEGVRPFRLIREVCGQAMDLMVELHGLWDLESAKRIIRALEPFSPAWFEDPIRMDDIESLAELARFTRIPILASETTAPKESFRRLFEQRAVGIVSFDVGWCGGFTEARKIAAMADAYNLPIVPHDCTGPVNFVAGANLALTQRNAMLQEMVRAYTRGWYRDVVTTLPRVENGCLYPLPGAGLGLDLKPEFLNDGRTIRRLSGTMKASPGQ